MVYDVILNDFCNGSDEPTSQLKQEEVRAEIRKGLAESLGRIDVDGIMKRLEG